MDTIREIDMNSESGWFVEERKEGWIKWMVRMLISSGPIPKHLAFVMDGNRRYAKTKHLGNVLKGHEKGFEQLARIMDWCTKFNVTEITVYAFSIENFKRSDDEVGGLMKLAEKKFQKLLDDPMKLEKEEVCFRFYGNRKLLSEKLQGLMKEIEKSTEMYEKRRVNICMPYTSRDEIARSFEVIRKNVKEGNVNVDEINESMIDACLDSGLGGTPPDLFVRTSGEHRLSDFQMWQCASTHVYFDDVLWPEFGYFNLCKAILNYQYYRSTVQKVSEASSDSIEWRREYLGGSLEPQLVPA